MTAVARPARAGDTAVLCALQARIIALGGTTAHQVPFSEAEFAQHYLTGPEVICCHVAEENGREVGFQAVGRHPDLPADWGDIGSYVDPDVQRSGAGQALFAATLVAVRAAGLAVLNATIRADNAPGLAYYARIGFRDHGSQPDFALPSGQVVGRIHRRFDL